MKDRLITIGITAACTLAFVVLFFFIYNTPDDIDHEIIDRDYHEKDNTGVIDFKIIDEDYYEKNVILEYDQADIESYLRVTIIPIERAVEIANLILVDLDFDNTVKWKQPYLVYIDEENNVYIIVAESISLVSWVHSSVLRIIIDRNTGGILSISRLMGMP